MSCAAPEAVRDGEQLLGAEQRTNAVRRVRRGLWIPGRDEGAYEHLGDGIAGQKHPELDAAPGDLSRASPASLPVAAADWVHMFAECAVTRLPSALWWTFSR